MDGNLGLAPALLYLLVTPPPHPLFLTLLYREQSITNSYDYCSKLESLEENLAHSSRTVICLYLAVHRSAQLGEDGGGGAGSGWEGGPGGGGGWRRGGGGR